MEARASHPATPLCGSQPQSRFRRAASGTQNHEGLAGWWLAIDCLAEPRLRVSHPSRRDVPLLVAASGAIRNTKSYAGSWSLD